MKGGKIEIKPISSERTPNRVSLRSTINRTDLQQKSSFKNISEQSFCATATEIRHQRHAGAIRVIFSSKKVLVNNLSLLASVHG